MTWLGHFSVYTLHYHTSRHTQLFQMLGAYSVSKTALLGLSKAVATQVACNNIRANCIAPGIIKTRFSSPVSSMCARASSWCLCSATVYFTVWRYKIELLFNNTYKVSQLWCTRKYCIWSRAQQICQRNETKIKTAPCRRINVFLSHFGCIYEYMIWVPMQDSLILFATII